MFWFWYRDNAGLIKWVRTCFPPFLCFWKVSAHCYYFFFKLLVEFSRKAICAWCFLLGKLFSNFGFFSYTLPNLGIKRSWKKVTAQNCLQDWVWIKPICYPLQFAFFFSFHFLPVVLSSLKLEREPELKNDVLHGLQVPGKSCITAALTFKSFTTDITQVCPFKVHRCGSDFQSWGYFSCHTLLSNQQGKLEGPVQRKVAQLPSESEWFSRIIAVGRFYFMSLPICSDLGVMLWASGNSVQSGLSLEVIPLPTEPRRSTFRRSLWLMWERWHLWPLPMAYDLCL